MGGWAMRVAATLRGGEGTGRRARARRAERPHHPGRRKRRRRRGEGGRLARGRRLVYLGARRRPRRRATPPAGGAGGGGGPRGGGRCSVQGQDARDVAAGPRNPRRGRLATRAGAGLARRLGQEEIQRRGGWGGGLGRRAAEPGEGVERRRRRLRRDRRRHRLRGRARAKQVQEVH